MRRAQMPVLIMLAVCALVRGATTQAADEVPHCAILDDRHAPLYEIGVTFTPQQRFEGYGHSAVVEFDVDWEFAYFRDILWGNLDLHFQIQSALFMDSTRLQLPDQVAMIGLDAGWTHRRPSGMAVQVRAQPGVYSDLEEIGSDTLYVPFSCALIQAFTPQLSGTAGLELRFGFDREIMPIIGVDWRISDLFELEARLPRSRLIYLISNNWNTEMGFSWENTSFSLREKGSYNRRQITLEDLRAYWSITRSVSDGLQLTFELGRVFSREVDFARNVENLESNVDPDAGAYVRVALGRPF